MTDRRTSAIPFRLAAALLAWASTWLPAAPASAQRVEQYGEVAIVEGAPDFVGSGDSGAAIRYDATHKDPQNLARAFFSRYPDEFDALVILTTFSDGGMADTLAYELSAKNEVHGIGVRPDRAVETFDESAAWGATRHRLAAFVNMKGIADYPGYDGRAIDDPRSMFHRVLGHELGHRWLAYARYLDGNGQLSARLLGRGGSHWSPLLEAGGSLLDGNRWVERQDGSFDCAEREARYSPLDLYLMGLAPAAAVPPMFLINNAATDDGRVVDPATDWTTCEHLRGDREEVTMARILDALGPREPAFPDAPRDFRTAFVVVTRPGERAADVLPLVEQAERARPLWERAFAGYTGGAGTVCTRLSVPCGVATASVLGGDIVEAGGDGDGIIEPGEPIEVAFVLHNEDAAAATAPLTLTASSDGARFPASPVALAPLAAGERRTVRLRGTFSDDPAACDAPLLVRAEVVSAQGTFRGFASRLVGARERLRLPFDADAAGWGVNLDGGDDALVDGWAWGSPRSYRVGQQGGFVFQPDGGADDSAAAWFTGPERGDVATGAWHALSTGRSTLWSPPLDLSTSAGARPRLRYAAWVEVLDGATVAGRPATLPGGGDGLTLEARSAASGRWYKLDQVNGAEARWRRRDVDLLDPVDGERGLDLSSPVELRFTATRASDSALVEIGVDELVFVEDAPGCRGGELPDGGAGDGSLAPPFALPGCALSPGAASAKAGALEGATAGPALLLAMLLLHRHRRRRGGGAAQRL